MAQGLTCAAPPPPSRAAAGVGLDSTHHGVVATAALVPMSRPAGAPLAATSVVPISGGDSRGGESFGSKLMDGVINGAVGHVRRRARSNRRPPPAVAGAVESARARTRAREKERV